MANGLIKLGKKYGTRPMVGGGVPPTDAAYDGMIPATPNVIDADNPYAMAELGQIGIDASTMKPFDPNRFNVPAPAATMPSAAPVAAPAASEAPRVSPMSAIYKRLLEGLQGRLETRGQFYDEQAADLAERVAQQRELAQQGMANTAAVLQNAVNPYRSLTPTTAVTTGNPLAAYLEATGVDPAQAEATVALAAAENQAYNDAVANSLATLGAAYQQADTSRLADLELARAGFESDLAGQQNAILAALATQRAAEESELQNLIAQTGLQELAGTQTYEQNRQQNQISLLNNILNAYGSDLAPESVVELVTAFANAIGLPAADVLGGVA